MPRVNCQFGSQFHLLYSKICICQYSNFDGSAFVWAVAYGDHKVKPQTILWSNTGRPILNSDIVIFRIPYSDVIMGAMTSQITGASIVSSTGSGVDQRKYQSSAWLAYVRGIHRWPVSSPHKGPVTWRMSPFDGKTSLYWGGAQTDKLCLIKHCP